MKIPKTIKSFATVALTVAISLNSVLPVFAAEAKQTYQMETRHHGATEDTYKVTFKAVGKGSIGGPQTVKVADGGYVNQIPTAKPFSGCKFIGWVDEDHNPVDPLTEEITENRTFTATFEEPVAVTFKAVGRGSIGGPQTVKVLAGGYVTVIPTAKPFSGCKFIGWVDENSNPVDPLTIEITENRTFTATFEEPVAVTFKSTGKGSISGPQTVKVLAGGYVTVIPTPIPFKNYEFAGWVDEENKPVNPLTVEITKNRVFTATFENEKVQEFTVTYDPNNGKLLSGTGTEKVALNGKPVNVPTAYMAYTKFAGWMDKTGLLVDPSTVVITEDTTFKAKYTCYEFTVTYNVNGGQLISGITTEYVVVRSKPVNVPTVALDKYKFIGWTDKTGTLVDPTTVVITVDTTFTAQYKKNEFVVTYDIGNGYIISGTLSEIVGSDHNPVNVPIVGHSKFRFAGWMDANGNIIDPTSVLITEDTTFIAQYKAIEYADVKYGIGAGIIVSGSLSEVVELGEKPTKVPTVDHSKAIFIGWADEDGTIVDPTTVIITKDTRFTAQYQVIEYVRVKYDAGAGFVLSGSLSEMVRKGGSPTNIPKVFNPFAKFIGWEDKEGNIVDPTTVTVTTSTTFTAKYDIKEQ